MILEIVKVCRTVSCVCRSAQVMRYICTCVYKYDRRNGDLFVL